MFYSRGNNFGAGTIKFREARESNYIVLNATIKVDTRTAQYAAAEVLEIYVPDLNIGRSTETGVVMYYPDSIDWYGTIYCLDHGTFVKSWIKDKNTICIEKLSMFNNQEEVTIFIQTMYCQLGQGSNTVKVTTLPLVDASAESIVSFNDTDSIIVVREDWVFVHLLFQRCEYGHNRDDWEAIFENMPADIDVELPFVHTAFWNGNKYPGCVLATVEDQHWYMPFAKRTSDLNNNMGDPFSFAFLVRGDNDE
jgi:hypothetical protein